jgi:hypothetical protein
MARQKASDRLSLILKGEGDAEQAPFEQREHRFRAAREPSDEEAGLGEHGLRREQRRRATAELLARPVVERVPPVQEGDQRPGVDQDGRAHLPYPSR